MARRKQPAIPDQVLDQLLAGADAKSAFDKDGLLDELKKAVRARGRTWVCVMADDPRRTIGRPFRGVR